MIEYIILFTIKVLDNVLGTGKTILIQKGKGLLAAITVTISQLIFFKIINEVISSSSDNKMILVSVAAGFGTFLAIKLNEKFSKDKLFINNITSDDKEAMSELCIYLRENKIKNLITDSYTKDWGKTLSVTVFAETKEDSKLVSKFLEESENKYLRIIS